MALKRSTGVMEHAFVRLVADLIADLQVSAGQFHFTALLLLLLLFLPLLHLPLLHLLLVLLLMLLLPLLPPLLVLIALHLEEGVRSQAVARPTVPPSVCLSGCLESPYRHSHHNPQPPPRPPFSRTPASPPLPHSLHPHHRRRGETAFKQSHPLD